MAHKLENRPVTRPVGRRPHESGGEVVTVTVTLNNSVVFSRSAVITGSQNNNPRRYRLDDGGIINHNRNQGSKELARKMLVQ